MKQILVPLVAILLLSFTEKKTIEIEYSAELKSRIYDNTISEAANDFLNDNLNEKKSLVKFINFKLLSDGNKYFFSYKKPMVSDNYNVSVTSIVSRILDGNDIYTDLNDSISYLGGFDVWVNIDRKLNPYDVIWDISKSKKEILGLTCYKATGTLKDIRFANSKSFPIVAWFCPSLSFRGGPTPHGTLPGIILEFETPQAVLTAKSYKLVEKKIEEYKNKNRVMSYPEYLEFIDDWNKKNRKRNEN
ncbi:GLPGLI family protein [Mangrovimonas sp. CR14]|uniref:GLPGLI family protein n=1 Tax=Mangrovimonas sp. CR14 TaxID=2706120 RepID=UPI001421194D|nr:GLPGLI family protein [Mangrovimonas sp. CR14]NIK90990.1 GLPGLI family protein [Mangrovimonas sp. CR14]